MSLVEHIGRALANVNGERKQLNFTKSSYHSQSQVGDLEDSVISEGHVFLKSFALLGTSTAPSYQHRDSDFIEMSLKPADMLSHDDDEHDGGCRLQDLTLEDRTAHEETNGTSE